MADGAPAERLGEIIRRQREPSERVLDAIAAALQVSADTLYEQAGMTVGEEPETSAVEQAVREDPRLTGRQRQALLEVYRAFVAHTRPAPRSRRREG
jgi:transcriptional regulator with XRE-family HTH domain